jgi:hypothetical protein
LRDGTSFELPTISLVENDGVTYIELSYRLRKGVTGFAISIETATDLSDWVDAGFTIQRNLDNGDGTSSITVRENTPVIDAGSRQFRLRVDEIAP